jgi:hypothetical protein
VIAMTRVLVSGAIANKCRNGGEAWVRLNWALGLRKLGCDVAFVEQIDRGSCHGVSGRAAPFAQSVNLAYFEQVMADFGLPKSALICGEGEEIHGISREELFQLADSADLLLNITGHLAWPELFGRVRCRVYLDIDPGFTQFWHASGNAATRLAGHHHYFTIAENIGAPDCTIPADGIPWRRTRQPVVLEEWPVSSGGDAGRFTTVASWRGPFGPVEYGGRRFGLKVHEFRKMIDLPARVRSTFEIALDIDPADSRDRHALLEHGWHLADPLASAGDPGAFRSYVQQSGAEFSVAQGIYVETSSGWFSDRTVRYLASGKPALVQDTGFSRNYPVGRGLLAFRTLDEAAAGAEAIRADYERHCRAARALSEEYFDSDKVLLELLDSIGAAP